MVNMQDGQIRETASADRSAPGLADDRRRATWLTRVVSHLTSVAAGERDWVERFPSRHGFTVL